MIAAGTALLGFVTAQRLAELAVARRNTRRLLAAGAREVGAAHYPVIVAVHALWLAALWVAAWDAPVAPVWWAVFAALQAFRLWVMLSLGARWTTRIIILDGAPLVARGPYRWMRHPNYVLVVAEISLIPLMLGQPWIALAFGIANAGALAMRIRAEERALAPLRGA